MDRNRFWKGFVVASSMLSLTFIPVLTPAFAENVIPETQVTAGSYLTREQFTEYNLWTNYINDYRNIVRINSGIYYCLGFNSNNLFFFYLPQCQKEKDYQAGCVVLRISYTQF